MPSASNPKCDEFSSYEVQKSVEHVPGEQTRVHTFPVHHLLWS